MVTGLSALQKTYDMYERKHINHKLTRHTNGSESNNRFLRVPKHMKTNVNGRTLNNGMNPLKNGQIYI